MARWTRIGRLDECPPGNVRELVAEDRVVAVANVAGRLFAIDGVCPHQGGPLGQGRLEGTTLTCPWHGWQFDVASGVHADTPAVCQRRMAVRLEGNEMFVDLEPDEPDPAAPT